MNFKQKLVYMLVGSLFTIAGYLIASLPNNQSQDAHAQENANNVFDEIVCKKLLIVDNNGKQLVKMGEVRGGMEAGKEGEGGYIFVYNNEEMAVVGIDTVQQGHGTISVSNKQGKITVDMQGKALFTNGGGITVSNSDGHEGVFIDVADGNGEIRVLDTTKRKWRSLSKD